MIVLLVFAFVSGLITIAAPCIWPLLPIILSSSATGGKQKALGITLGIIVSFGLLTLTISYIVKVIPFNPDVLRYLSVIIIALLGLTLVVPKFAAVLEALVSRFSGRFVAKNSGSGLFSGLVTGLSLGIVWTPCAGPILATIATLAATRSVNSDVILVTIAYIIGVGIPLFIFALAGSHLFTKSRFLSRYTGRIQQIFGVVMIITAVLIATNYDKILQAKLLNVLPAYSNFITSFENNSSVQQELNRLKGINGSLITTNDQSSLPNQGKAPNFAGITKWLNPEQPLTMEELRGKVVLVDFWTYTCINCIRTLPYVTSWYDKYKDKGFVVVGIHTPEFEFEKNTNNVLNAIKQYNIHYPIAQDNNYATWKAFHNQAWPAKYLIDSQGNIRYFHEGEGAYDTTEKHIQQLLQEMGQTANMPYTQETGDNVTGVQTPETYLGLARMDNFASPQNPRPGSQTYTIPQSIPLDGFAYGGIWLLGDEQAIASAGSQLALNFSANKVFLVITPKTSSDTITVMLDGKPITDQNAGSDVTNSTVTVTEPRLYNLIDFHGAKGKHLLQLQFNTAGTAVFAFTFG